MSVTIFFSRFVAPFESIDLAAILYLELYVGLCTTACTTNNGKLNVYNYQIRKTMSVVQTNI